MINFDEQINHQESQLNALEKLRISESLKLKKLSNYTDSAMSLKSNHEQTSEIYKKLEEINKKINENYEQLSLLKIRRYMIA
ncbi:unnamed protein product [marine sediment metagenome]|uniref:Uncharacterized protein n=1 Tax=marine sediment metagenome TaxID=412755 RepID=X1TNH5_9ZZZZ